MTFSVNSMNLPRPLKARERIPWGAAVLFRGQFVCSHLPNRSYSSKFTFKTYAYTTFFF